MDDQERELAAATEAELKEDELELSLGLRPAPSIGRNFHLSKPKSPVPQGTGDLSLSVPIWGKGGAGSDLDSEGLGFEKEAKREAQALRRQEARKKREEKRKLKANAFSGNSNGDDFSKRRRTGDQRYSASNGFEGAPLVPVPVPVPVTTSFMVRPQGKVNGNQFNGLPYYMVMPGLVGGDGSALQPAAVAAAGFRPYLVAEKNSGDGSPRVDNAKHSVSGCSRGSSPGVSDHRSSSGQGGSSSDGGSDSSQSRPLAPMTTNGPTTANGKAEGGSSSCQIEPIQTLKTAPNPVEVATNSSKTKSCHIERNSSVQSETSPSKKPSLPTHTNEATSVVNPSKPPKPPAQKSSEAVLLSEMPYVSTTGNGPNGKTITGFLYKYTQSEVCIVCVCHGSFLTPAGFVEHAGGVDVDNPLRHITVVPFTFP